MKKKLVGIGAVAFALTALAVVPALHLETCEQDPNDDTCVKPTSNCTYTNTAGTQVSGKCTTIVWMVFDQIHQGCSCEKP